MANVVVEWPLTGPSTACGYEDGALGDFGVEKWRSATVENKARVKIFDLFGAKGAAGTVPCGESVTHIEYGEGEDLWVQITHHASRDTVLHETLEAHCVGSLVHPRLFREIKIAEVGSRERSVAQD